MREVTVFQRQALRDRINDIIRDINFDRDARLALRQNALATELEEIVDLPDPAPLPPTIEYFADAFPVVRGVIPETKHNLSATTIDHILTDEELYPNPHEPMYAAQLRQADRARLEAAQRAGDPRRIELATAILTEQERVYRMRIDLEQQIFAITIEIRNLNMQLREGIRRRLSAQDRDRIEKTITEKVLKRNTLRSDTTSASRKVQEMRQDYYTTDAQRNFIPPDR
jgi:hypothetical protein